MEKKSILNRPWHHRVLFAGKHTHFTHRMLIEALCADVIDNYWTEIRDHRFYTKADGRTYSFALSPEEEALLEKRLAVYRKIRASGSPWDYAQIPEWLEYHAALYNDQPDIFPGLEKYASK